MLDRESLIALACAAQAKGGQKATIQLDLPRVPTMDHVKNLRLYPTQGPWGRIVKRDLKATRTEFLAKKILDYFGKGTTYATTKDRVQIHPVVSRSLVETITTLAATQQKSISAVVEDALAKYAGALNA